MKSLIAALLLATALPSLNAQDPCAQLASSRSPRPSEALACYTSFPFNAKNQAKTIKVLNNVMDIHAFTDVLSSSPNPAYQQSVDVNGLLRTLGTSTYKSDYEFQLAISKYFDAMQDGHFSYTGTCYSRISFKQPFIVHAVAQGNANPKIVILGTDDQVSTSRSMGLSKFIGAELVEIDGQNAYTYLQAVGDNLWSKGKDPNVRFNRAIAQKMFDSESGSFFLARGAFSGRTFPVPNSDSVRYTFKLSNGQSQSIDVPWVGTNNGGWTDASSFWSKNCAPRTATDGQEGEEGTKPKKHTEQELFAPGPEEIVQLKHVRTTNPSNTNEAGVMDEVVNPKPILTGPDFGFFVVERTGKSPIGVFAMTGYENANEEWTSKIQQGFTELSRRGVRKVVLDMSNNGGGTICTAYKLLQLITPQVHRPFATDFRVGKVVTKLTQAAYRFGQTLFHPSNWVDARTGRSFRDMSIISPSRSRSLTAGKIAPVPYSQLVLDGCRASWDFQLPFQPKDMILLSNGFCASSCAIFASHLYENSPELKQVVTTAYPQSKTVSGILVPGGQVYHNGDINQDIKSLRLTSDPDLDFNFPTNVDVAFVLREAYSRNTPGMVLDWLKMESHARVAWTERNGLNPQQIWLDAASAVGF